MNETIEKLKMYLTEPVVKKYPVFECDDPRIGYYATGEYDSITTTRLAHFGKKTLASCLIMGTLVSLLSIPCCVAQTVGSSRSNSSSMDATVEDTSSNFSRHQ